MTADECFAILERCASNGERCPVNHPMGTFNNRLVSILVREGRIRTEVFTKNWRVVTILTGPHKGKSTAPPPRAADAPPPKPYIVCDKDGTRRSGRYIHPRRRGGNPVTLRKFSWDEASK